MRHTIIATLLLLITSSIPALAKEYIVFAKDIIDIQGELLLMENQAKISKELNLVIDSVGGYESSYALFALTSKELKKKHNITINCYIPRMALSSAFMMLEACDRRYVKPGASLMFHCPHYRGVSFKDDEILNAKSLREYARLLDETCESFIRAIKYITGFDETTIKLHLEAETMWNAKDLYLITKNKFIIKEDMKDEELAIASNVDNLFNVRP